MNKMTLKYADSDIILVYIITEMNKLIVIIAYKIIKLKCYIMS